MLHCTMLACCSKTRGDQLISWAELYENVDVGSTEGYVTINLLIFKMPPHSSLFYAEC